MRHGLTLGAAVALAGGVACGNPQILVPGVLSVEFYPPHGSVEISVNVQGLIAFSHEVANPTAAAERIELACLGSPDPLIGCRNPDVTDCPASTAATVGFDSDGMEARVTPSPSLQTDTCYVFTVTAGIEAAADTIAALPSDRRSAFRTY
jgi:hypothetical protein